MNPNPLTIFVIIVICAAVFGGIVFLGSRGTSGPAVPVPITPGATTRIPDILNLPGFGNRQNQQPAPVQLPSSTPGPDIIVEKSELPSPTIPSAPAPSQPSKLKSFIPAPSRTPVPPPVPTPQPQQVPQPAPAPIPPPQTAAAAFSVFKATPQLGDFRTQMVQEGIIKDSEFAQIKNNTDMEQFMLKLVDWQARKAGSTDAQIQDALDRIRKAYSQARSVKK